MPAPPEWEAHGTPLTLRDLITRIVLEEVQAFRERRAERRLIRALTKSQIAEGVGRGKVEMGGREDEPDVATPEPPSPRPCWPSRTACTTCSWTTNTVWSLNEEIRLRTESRVTFLRLVALAGG